MLAAVDFNHQPPLPATKIHNDAADYELAAKPEAYRPSLPKSMPQTPFRVGLFKAQLRASW